MKMSSSFYTGFSRVLNKNIMSAKVHEVPGALGDPGRNFSWSFKLISFRNGPKSLLGVTSLLH